ncbi:MAG: hypothetical protein ACK4LB_11140 [Spirosomataceae bacterium]
MYKAFVSISLVGILMACQNQTKEKDPFLEEAYQLHLEAIEIQQDLEPKIDSLVKLDSVRFDSLRIAFQNWEESLVEVPGFEHDHDHEGHDHHHHDHGAAQPDVTPQQMKAIQNESLQNIKKLKALVEQP